MLTAFVFVLAMASVCWGWDGANLQTDKVHQMMIPNEFRFESVPSGCFEVKKLDHGSHWTNQNPSLQKKKTRWVKAKDNANAIQKGWYYDGVYKFEPKGTCELYIKLWSPSGDSSIGDNFTVGDITMLMRPGRRAEEIAPAGFKERMYAVAYSVTEKRRLVDVLKNQPTCVGAFLTDANGFVSGYIARDSVRNEEVNGVFILLLVFNN